MTPSSLFIESGKEEVVDPEAEAAEGDGEVIEMNWHCKSGMAANMNLVKNEFAKARGLRPVKILVTGPPCSGKSFFGQ